MTENLPNSLTSSIRLLAGYDAIYCKIGNLSDTTAIQKDLFTIIASCYSYLIVLNTPKCKLARFIDPNNSLCLI